MSKGLQLHTSLEFLGIGQLFWFVRLPEAVFVQGGLVPEAAWSMMVGTRGS